MNSFLTNALALIKGQLEPALLPMLIAALQILQKSPNAMGVGAAEAYLVGNAPAALLSAETALLQATINDLNSRLQALMAAQVAPAKAP
jgi:hypothetical protein